MSTGARVWYNFVEMTSLSIPSFLAFDPVFALVITVALMALYLEDGVATYLLFSNRGRRSAGLLIGAAAVVTLVGYWCSFFVLRPVHAPNTGPTGSVVWPRLVAQWPVAASVIVICSAVVYGLYLAVANLNLEAAYTLLKDLYLYTLIGAVLLHGVILYVRYAQFVYHVQQANFIKILATSGGLGALLLILTLYLLALNLRNLDHTRGKRQAILAFHLYARAMIAISIVIVIYIWHIRWLADH